MSEDRTTGMFIRDRSAAAAVEVGAVEVGAVEVVAAREAREYSHSHK